MRAMTAGQATALAAAAKNNNEGEAEEWLGLMAHRRVQLLEICCSPKSILTETMTRKAGENSAERAAARNGFDLATRAGAAAARRKRAELRPMHLWVSVPCGPWSQLQNLNQRTDQQRQELHRKRTKSLRIIDAALGLLEDQILEGGEVHWEWPKECGAYKLPKVRRIMGKYSMIETITNGCMVGLRSSSGELMAKPWRIMTTSEKMAKHLNLPCQGNHKHAPCMGAQNAAASSYYPKPMADKVVSTILEKPSWQVALRGIRDTGGEAKQEECFGTQGGEQSRREGEQDLYGKANEDVLRWLRMLHTRSGHTSMINIAEGLRRQGASPEVVKMAKEYQCPACQKCGIPPPRPFVGFEPPPQKMEICESDFGEWKHPVTNDVTKFQLNVDVATKLRCGQVAFEQQGPRNINSEEAWRMYLHSWHQLFGHPRVLRVDPDGAWKANTNLRRVESEGVFLDVIPGEAHHWISTVEESIREVKGCMSKLAAADSEISGTEAFYRAVHAALLVKTL